MANTGYGTNTGTRTLSFKSKISAFAVIGLAFVGTVSNVHAGVILSPIAVVANTLGTCSAGCGNILNTHNGSGLPAFTSGVTDFGAYTATTPAHAAFTPSNAWAADGIVTGDIDYDLGGSFNISQVAIWNQGNSAGVNSFTIFIASDAAFVTAVNVGTFAATQTLSAETFALTSSTGRYVRLRINSNHGSSLTTLGEIAFGAVTEVPEPGMLAIFGLGLAGLGFARRKKQTA